MESISNSGVSLILNPDIVNAIDDHRHQHDLSTCEEEFENQEEIQQMLANAFDSQSLSNTDQDENIFDDEDENPQPIVLQNSFHQNHLKSDEEKRLRDENENLRHQLTESIRNEELFRQRLLNNERQIDEINEKHEQILFDLRLEFEHKNEKFIHQISEQQIEMLTIKQKYESIFEEKYQRDEQINEMRIKEQNLKEQMEKLQIDYNQLAEMNKKKSIKQNVSTQTDIDERKIEELTEENIRLNEEIKQLHVRLKEIQINLNEREQMLTVEKNQYEKRLKDLSKRPAMICAKIQTDFVEQDESKILKQLKIEIDDYKLKLNSKQIELNTLKFDFENLKHEMSERLSMKNSNEQFDEVLAERDRLTNELIKLKTELPELKQQMIDSFRLKVVSFKEQVKTALAEKENEYQKKIEQVENEYIAQYEQVLEKNRQLIRSLIATKQEEFNNEKTKIIAEYEEKLNLFKKQIQIADEERRDFEQKINELTRINEKYNKFINKHDYERRQRNRCSMKIENLDETKRKHNDEIHRLYDQIVKQNQQQILLIDEHQKQIEQLKLSYDQRYRVLLDEWKIYNNDLHESNAKLKMKLRDAEKTIVQLRYHIVNIQIEYLQNGGNAQKILPISDEIK